MATFMMIESASQESLLHGDLYSKRDGHLAHGMMINSSQPPEPTGLERWDGDAPYLAADLKRSKRLRAIPHSGLHHQSTMARMGIPLLSIIRSSFDDESNNLGLIILRETQKFWLTLHV